MRKALTTITAIALLATLAMACGCSQSSSASAAASSSSTSDAVVSSSSSAASNEGAMPDTVFGQGTRYVARTGDGQMAGLFAVFETESSNCTPENLATWCEQYWRFSSEDWSVILFTDKPGYGVYAMGDGGFIDVNVRLEKNPDGTYSEADDSEASFYMYDTQQKELKQVG